MVIEEAVNQLVPLIFLGLTIAGLLSILIAMLSSIAGNGRVSVPSSMCGLLAATGLFFTGSPMLSLGALLVVPAVVSIHIERA